LGGKGESGRETDNGTIKMPVGGGCPEHSQIKGKGRIKKKKCRN